MKNTKNKKMSLSNLRRIDTSTLLLFVLHIFIVLFFTSCFTERIDIDLNENNEKIVVSAWITDLDEPQFVKLSYTSNYLDNQEPAAIKGAAIQFFNNNSTYILEEKEDGVYFLPENWIVEFGEEYTLSITINGEKYEAKSMMRACPEIEHLDIVEYEDEEGEISLVTTFDFQELEGEGDGYFGRDYKLGSLRKDSLSNGSFISDDLIDGIYFEEVILSQEGFSIGDTAVVEIFSIGIEASNFLQDIESEIFRGGLFDAPPVNIRTNISNGAIGYFILGSARREMIVVE